MRDKHHFRAPCEGVRHLQQGLPGPGAVTLSPGQCCCHTSLRSVCCHCPEEQRCTGGRQRKQTYPTVRAAQTLMGMSRSPRLPHNATAGQCAEQVTRGLPGLCTNRDLGNITLSAASEKGTPETTHLPVPDVKQGQAAGCRPPGLPCQGLCQQQSQVVPSVPRPQIPDSHGTGLVRWLQR